jgi:hypothetical protein
MPLSFKGADAARLRPSALAQLGLQQGTHKHLICNVNATACGDNVHVGWLWSSPACRANPRPARRLPQGSQEPAAGLLIRSAQERRRSLEATLVRRFERSLKFVKVSRMAVTRGRGWITIPAAGEVPANF